jgi:hypothetical protein
VTVSGRRRREVGVALSEIVATNPGCRRFAVPPVPANRRASSPGEQDVAQLRWPAEHRDDHPIYRPRAGRGCGTLWRAGHWQRLFTEPKLAGANSFTSSRLDDHLLCNVVSGSPFDSSASALALAAREADREYFDLPAGAVLAGALPVSYFVLVPKCPSPSKSAIAQRPAASLANRERPRFMRPRPM